MVEKATIERKTETIPCEQKYESEIGVKIDPAFCLGPTFKKTNSDILLTFCVLSSEVLVFIYRTLYLDLLALIRSPLIKSKAHL